MLPSEIAKLLAYAQVLDRRLGDVDEFKVYAWKDSLHPDMPFELARSFVSKHYSQKGEMLMPYILNDAFRIHRNSQVQREMLPEPDPVDPEIAAKYLQTIRETLKSSFMPPDANLRGEKIESERILDPEN